MPFESLILKALWRVRNLSLFSELFTCYGLGQRVILSGSDGYNVNREQWPVATYHDSVLDFSEWGLGTKLPPRVFNEEFARWQVVCFAS